MCNTCTNFDNFFEFYLCFRPDIISPEFQFPATHVSYFNVAPSLFVGALLSEISKQVRERGKVTRRVARNFDRVGGKQDSSLNIEIFNAPCF